MKNVFSRPASRFPRGLHKCGFCSVSITLFADNAKKLAVVKKAVAKSKDWQLDGAR